MNKVRELEQAVLELTPDDLVAFRAWFTEFDACLWGKQIEIDIALARLDNLADEALEDLSEGRCIDL